MSMRFHSKFLYKPENSMLAMNVLYFVFRWVSVAAIICYNMDLCSFYLFFRLLEGRSAFVGPMEITNNFGCYYSAMTGDGGLGVPVTR